MKRPVTEEERQVLMANPELIMFAPRQQGIHPTVFLLVIPVTTMVILAAVLWFTGAANVLVNTAPVASTLAFVAICVATPWACLYIKRQYDEAYGCDRELRRLLSRDLMVEVVHITGSVLQRAEVYAEVDGQQFIIGIASTKNTFVPDTGSNVAILYADDATLCVKPDPKTQSLLM